MDRDFDLSAHYPIFGPEIECPHCRQTIPALTLTDSYLCSRHGAFEVNPHTQDLVHLQSNRCWRYWEGRWYRQHTHPDGIRFEIHEALDRLYTQGYRATRVIIAVRYQDLIASYLDRGISYRNPDDPSPLRLYGLPVQFSPSADAEPCWGTINFDLEKEPGAPVRYPYFQVLE
jgi:uncharacterized protein (TIGR02652 family)